MDLMGRMIYTSSSLHMQIANQQALLSKYDFVNWTSMSKFTAQMPETIKQEFGGFIAEGGLVARR